MYRFYLIKLLEKKYDVKTIGLFDNVVSFIKAFFIFKNKCNFIISSNIKSNIISLSLYTKEGVIIINGLGRLRNFKIFRFLIFHLLKKNKKKIIICQNYLEFRYLKNMGLEKIIWIPGSGGSKRFVSKKGKVIVVTRKSKIKTIKKSIEKFCKKIKNVNINFVGIDYLTLKKYFPTRKEFSALGFVNQADIFSSGNVFFQPSGYGEGIPHSLVDAIASKMNVMMFKKEFVQFGFYKLKIFYKSLGDNLIAIFPQKKTDQLCLELINKKYRSVIQKTIKLG